MIAFLQELRRAPASLLELGVGTGRLAIPLAQHGYRVHGIDASPSMLAKLHENDATGGVTSSVGDFSALVVEERYDLVLIALNTFFMLPTQEQQIDCLRSIHDALADGGAAVFETYNLQTYQASPRQRSGSATWRRTPCPYLRSGATNCMNTLTWCCVNATLY